MRGRSALRDKNKRLTDFFTPRSSTPIPGPATTSNAVESMAPSPTARKKQAVRASKAVMDCEPSVHSNAPSEVRSTSGMMTRKRARSPDGLNVSAPPQRPAKLKAARRAANSDPPRAVVYVTSRSPSRNSLAQRSKLAQTHGNTLVASPSDSSKQVVYSSQSDEAELALPVPESRDLGKVVQSVHTWRRNTLDASSSSSPHSCEDAMEVDLPPSSPIRSSPLASSPVDAAICSAGASSSSTALQTPPAASARSPSSPDTNELSPLPLTPEPLDPEAKTAKLIAEIKARAYAANQSSDDDCPLSYRELEDSDDGDITDEFPLVSKGKQRSSVYAMPRTGNDIFSSPLSSVPSTFNAASSPLPRSVRTSTRTRKPAPPFHLPTTIAESPSFVAEKKPQPSNPKKSRVTNPLKALLREKQLQEKRGTSFAALRLAEEVVKQGHRETSIDSDDEFDPVLRLRLADEQAAWRTVHDARTSASPDDFSDAKNLIGDGASKMLGAVAGEAVNKILAGDKDGKGKEMARSTDQTTTLGVSLWTEHSDEDMDVDSISIIPLSGHPILTCLEGFLRDGDDLLLNSILRAGMLAAVPGDILSSNMPQLLDMILFASSQVADAVCIALRDLWGLNPLKVQMSLSAVLFALVRLGANHSTLEGFGLITEPAQRNNIPYETLSQALKRLLATIKTAAFAGAFASHDLANLVLSLAIVGLDPLTSGILRTQLNITMDVVCNYSATDYLFHDIHTKILAFARQLAPINKARLVSFFASGSGRTRRIAQHVAYALLVSVSTTLNHEAPPLEPLILSVSPEAGSHQLFDVSNESTDYEELRYYVDILSVALAEIAPYVEEENAAMKLGTGTSTQGSPGKPKKGPVPPLELLRRLLGVLQGKIVDTRAAHLDRSRAKAGIQRLAMRINYERMALIGIRPRQRASTLKAYFSPQRT